MGVISFFEMIVQCFRSKGIGIDLLEGGEVQGIGVAEKKDAVAFPEMPEQLDAFRREIQQERVPTVDDGLLGDLGAGQFANGVDELTVRYFADLIVFKKGSRVPMTEILPDVLYPQVGKGFFRTAIVQVDDDAAQIENDIPDALHRANLLQPIDIA